MNKHAAIALLIGLLIIVVGCGPAGRPSTMEGPSPSPSVTLTQPATAAGKPSPSPGAATALPLTSRCDLLTSREVAGFFTSAEVVGPTHKVSRVNQPVFTTATISATESSCLYYVYHLPGSKDMKLLQITYWVDLPEQVTAAAWAQAWSDAAAKATQTVSGLGEGAFFHEGRLTFKKDSAYLTVEAVGTDLHTDTSAGLAQQMEIEKTVAHDMLGRLE